MSEPASDSVAPSGPGARPTGRAELAGVTVALVVASLLFGLGISWDLPSARGWNYDELTPDIVHKSMRRGLESGWPDKYPPLQFRLVAPLYRAVLALGRHTAWEPTAYEIHNVWFLVSRGLSLLMGLGTVFLTWRSARRLVDSPSAVLGTSLVAFCLPMVYFSKLGNLDVPSVFWFAASFLALLRVLDRHRGVDYLLLGVTTAAAVATKDQVYGLYVVVPFVLLPALAASRRARGVAHPWGGLIVEPRLWGAVAVGCGVLAFAYGFGRDGIDFFAQHWARITGGYTERWRMFPPTWLGQLQNVALTGRNLLFSWGAPLCAAVALGLVQAWRGRRTVARPWQLAVPAAMAIGFHLTFLSVILYQFDRYLLPLAVLCAPFAGLGLASLTDGRRPSLRRAGVALVAIALLWSGWRALALDLHMRRDAREAAETWLDGHRRPGERVVGLGDARMLPRLEESWNWWRLEANRAKQGDPDLLVVNPRSLHGRETLYERFGTAEWPYDLAARIERPLRFDPIRVGGAETTLEFVNPPIEIWRRRAAASDPVEAPSTRE